MLKLYHTEWCAYCHNVRETLTELGLDYESMYVEADVEKRAELIRATGQNVVPALVDGETVVVGSAEIVEYLRATYPEAPDAAEHAAAAAWRAAFYSPLAPHEAVTKLKELLVENGFTVVAEVAGPAISEHLPDDYVLLQVTVPIAALRTIQFDPTIVSGVLLPIAVYPVEEGSVIASADPVGQVWLFGELELNKVQSVVKRRLYAVLEQLAQ